MAIAPTKEVLRCRAKAMRRAPTETEQRLWQILRAKRLQGFKFKRQVPIGGFIADFACLKHKLIIEVDGSQHSPEVDGRRDQWLRSRGYRVLRIWNDEVFLNEEGVGDAILAALGAL